MITTSKLNNSIVFSREIFWGPRANEMGTEGGGAEGRGMQTPLFISLIENSLKTSTFLYKNTGLNLKQIKIVV